MWWLTTVTLVWPLREHPVAFLRNNLQKRNIVTCARGQCALPTRTRASLRTWSYGQACRQPQLADAAVAAGQRHLTTPCSIDREPASYQVPASFLSRKFSQPGSDD